MKKRKPNWVMRCKVERSLWQSIPKIEQVTYITIKRGGKTQILTTDKTMITRLKKFKHFKVESALVGTSNSYISVRGYAAAGKLFLRQKHKDHKRKKK